MIKSIQDLTSSSWLTPSLNFTIISTGKLNVIYDMPAYLFSMNI